MLRVQSKPAIGLANAMSISGGAIDPPPWWVELLASRVKVGAGRSPVPPGMIRQADLISKLLERYGREYSAPEVSRACNAKRIPVQLAVDLSELVGIPSPVYVVVSEEEAGRMESQRAVTRTIIAATKERLIGQLTDMQAGAARPAKARQPGVVRPLSEEVAGSRRGESR
ncbi:MAG: hypothetical protein VW405_20685 [Rhodospirillaceae bacterium]